MAALPYMQLYVADYLADTMHLDAEEHGAYLLLLMNYWQTGKPIPKSRLQKIARVPSDRWTTVERTLSEFFNDTGTEWVHDRVERDLADVREAQEQRVKAGKASAEARKRAKRTQDKRDGQRETSDRSTSVTTTAQREGNEVDTDTDTDTEQNNKRPPADAAEPQSITKAEHEKNFETLWQSFDKTLGEKGSKKLAKQQYLKIKPDPDQFQTMIAALQDQIADKHQKSAMGQFAPNFPHVERWLKHRRWEDEISPAGAQQRPASGLSKSDRDDEAMRQYLEENGLLEDSDGSVADAPGVETRAFPGGQH